MINLRGSKWAPASVRPPESEVIPAPSTDDQFTARREDLERASKLLGRLRWKSQHLLISQARVLTPDDGAGVNGRHLHFDRDAAEANFKIDFFEWYVLLERVLVHLLAVFGIAISAANRQRQREETEDHITRSDVDPPVNNVQQRHIIGDGRSFHSSTHRFHANVLHALDQPANPLHTILGTADVRQYLGIAKEFRNRWKDVQERPTTSPDPELGVLRRYERLLKDLKLETMLEAVLAALDKARERTAEQVMGIHASTDLTPVQRQQLAMEMEMEVDMEDAPWEAMPDVMEWD